MRRVVSSIAWVATVLLCAASAALWARGHRVADVAYVRSPASKTHYMFASSKGRLGVFVTPFPPDRAAAGERFAYLRRPPMQMLRKGGFFRNYQRTLGVEVAWTPGRPGRAATLPTWWLVAVTGVPAIVWTRNRMRRLVRKARGWCPGCGYDLRASRNGCPECGAGKPAAGGST